MFSDSLFVAGFDEYLEKRLVENAASTFVYLYDFKSESSMSKFLGGGDFYYGVCHGDDIQVFFPTHKMFGLQPDSAKNADILRSALVEMWVNFAKFGYVFLSTWSKNIILIFFSAIQLQTKSSPNGNQLLNIHGIMHILEELMKMDSLY